MLEMKYKMWKIKIIFYVSSRIKLWLCYAKTVEILINCVYLGYKKIYPAFLFQKCLKLNFLIPTTKLIILIY